MWFTIFLLISIPSLYFLYDHICRELKDIDPVLLNHQTSISETRKPSESAIYRSVDVPHGVTVTRGLSLRSGYKIRDGCLKDIWYLALHNRKENKSFEKTSIQVEKDEFTLGQANSIIHIIADTLNNVTKSDKIAIFGSLTDNPELLFVVWSCFFVSDKTVIFCHSLDDLPIAKSLGCDTIFTDSFNIIRIPTELFDNIIGLNINESRKMNEVSEKFTQVVNISSDMESRESYSYDPESDFANVTNHIYSVINKGNETKFFQVNFVSSIASKLMSVPSSLLWNETDRLLISYTLESFTSTNIIFGSCCGLLSHVTKIQIVNPCRVNTLKKLSKLNPTILFIDSHIIKDICNSSKKTFWESFKLQRSEYFNSLGYFNSFGKLNKSLKLKLVYTCQLKPVLSSFICNFCKSVLGSRIVREVYSDFAIGPILKTNIYDFRIVQNRSMALLGVPANSVELKTVNAAEGETRGELYCRGMSVGKGAHLEADVEEYWVSSGVEGTFARDGCFYGNIL